MPISHAEIDNLLMKMDTKTGLKVIESFSGKGKIYKGEQCIDVVNYSIKELEEVPETESSGGQAFREVEQRTICGIVESTQVNLLYSYLGTRLTLQLQDGRILDFAVTEKLTGGNCLIKGLTSVKCLESAETTLSKEMPMA